MSTVIVRLWSYGASDPPECKLCTAGPSVGIDQTVFAVTEDTFLNLNTGAIAQLNNTQYITFNRSLDGTPAINYYGVGSSQTLLYVSPASFYSGGAGLDYLQIAPPAVSIPSNATSNSTRPVYLTTTQAWTKAVERLYYYTELVSLQAAVTTPCSNDSRYVYLCLNKRVRLSQSIDLVCSCGVPAATSLLCFEACKGKQQLRLL